MTPIGTRLEELFLAYLQEIEAAKNTKDPAVLKAIKPVNYIVITDGSPSKLCLQLYSCSSLFIFVLS
jgi:hypothetical protein